MYFQTLKNLVHKNNLNQADLARLVGVSRMTVKKWFQQGEQNNYINLKTKTLFKLAESFQLSSDFFLQKRELLSVYQTKFLWDALYPDMESFVKALAEEHLPAIARLVQVLGFYEARFILGKKIITLFDCYKKFIKPVRCKQLEILWPLYKS